MEETLTTGSTVSMETDLNMEYSSDTNNDSEDENSDVEITFGPWPPFPSKQNTEIPEDELVSKLDLQDVDYSDICEEEQDVDVESDGSEVSLDDHVDLESVENYTKTDDVTSQYVQSEESEMVDVVGPTEVADFIPEDTEAETDTDRYLASAVESTDITTDMASLPTECDDVISNCIPSDSAASLYTNDTVSSDVQGTQPPTEPSIVIKEEPNLDGYPDSSPPPEIPKDDNLFVSTEHGKMFIRSVATRPPDNEENEFDETESSTETIQLARSRSIADGSDKKTPKPVRVYVVKKTNFQEEETDNYRTDELKPGRIIGKNPGKKIIAIMDPAKGSTESDESHLHRQVLLPKPKTGKNKKISRKLKESEVMRQGARKITRKRKVISSDLIMSSPPVSGDDRTPDNQVLYNLRAKPADKEMGSLTVDNCQVDLSRVKTEPEDYSEQNQDNTATGAGIHEADPTSWIKKEPLTEDGGHVENAMESHMPVPVKLIRNEVVNTLTPDITIGNGFMTGAISQQESSSSKVFKKPASIMVGGRPVTLQSGQKIIYTLPKGGQQMVQSGGGSNQQKVVKVIKLNNLKNAPSVVPLTGNLKLFRLQKTPTVSSCEGKEIPLSSVLNHKKVTLTGETAENAKEDQEKKNLMLKKIDGIIKKNLELMKKNQVPTKKKVSLSSENTTIVTPQWSEGIDENTGKTTMILMPNVAQQKKIQTNKVIYRFDDRSKRSKKNKKDADISLSKNPITSSSTASPFTASSNMIPVSLPVKVTMPTLRKKPAMCDGFTQTKKDHPSVKKQVSGKAVMVKDACFQTDTFPENNKITDEDMSQETMANSSEVTSTSPTKPMATNSDDTDLVMDVEDVDYVTSKTMPFLDPITVPRPMWKWTGRDTSSIGVNTGEASRNDEDSTSPVEHQYAFAASKEKQRHGLFDMASVTEKVKHRKQCLKLQKMKKSIRRQTFLKNKEWEFDCKVTLLKQKLEDQKKSSSDNKTDKSVENKGPSVDMADEQIKHEENEDPMHDGSVGSMMGKKGESKEKSADAKSSGNTKSAVTELRTRSSSRIKYRQAVALRNADMTSFFERCQMKLGDVEDIADLESTPYITDSSDEDWKQTVNHHVRKKLKQLRKGLRNSDQSTSDSESICSEPGNDDDDDKLYKPGQEKRFIKVVVNPMLSKKEYKKKKKQYVDVKLEDHTDKWERKLFTSTLRQERNIAVECKSYEEYRCLLCTGHHAFHTSAAELMESHLEEHLNSNFPCRECDATFDLQSLLTEHCNKEHSVTCEICNQEFSSRGLYKRHIGRMHGQRSISCFKCNEKFKTKLLFKQHLLEVHPGSAHKCEKCGVILRKHLNAMQGHMNSKNCLRRQQGNLKTQCEICGKLVSENGIRKHKQRVHQKLRIYKCDVCSYAGITLQALKDHKKTHTGEHPVKCTLCDFSCIKPYQLKCHMRTHLKLKPYKCDKCSYAASWNVQVKDHMKAHFSPTRVDCTECNISFKDQRGLNLHRHKEHNEGTKDSDVKNSSPKKRGRPTRVRLEGKKKPNNQQGKRKKMEEEWSEEDDYTDTETQNDSSEEEKYTPRKSTRRRTTKQLDPQFDHSSEEEEEEENEGHEQIDSYVPSVSKIV